MAVTAGAAGTGSSGSGATLTPGYPAGVAADQLFLLDVLIASTAETATTPGGWALVSGPDDFSGARCYLFGKIATGSEAGTLTVNLSGANFKQSQMFSFSGNNSTSVAAAVEGLTVGNGTTNTVTMPTVTTTENGSLACAFTNSDSTSAVGSATGETGGDWTEAFAEYQTGIAQIQLQTAALATAGTITGGSFSIGTGTIWLRYGLGVKPPSAAIANEAGLRTAHTPVTWRT